MAQPKLVLSTVGIAVLLNSLSKEEDDWRRRLNQEANVTVLQPETDQKVEELKQRALDSLRRGDAKGNRALSAELNGLYGLYTDRLELGRADMQYLIATDTALGRAAADIVSQFLREQGMNLDVYVPEGLSTADPQTFSGGIKKLMHWCEETIPAYQQQGYRVIFNLTGAFKSLQGYLNIVGMFYADEIVYIFETGAQMLSIPRLPLQVDVNTLREHRIELALMAQGHIYPIENVQEIPSGLLEIDLTGHAFLSDWGQLIWNRVQSELFSTDEPLPFPRLQYTDTFRRDFRRASVEQRIELHKVLAKVSALLEDQDGDITRLKADGGLQYGNLSGKQSSDGRPIGHFRITQARRVTCTAQDGALRLRRFGEHEVNEHP